MSLFLLRSLLREIVSDLVPPAPETEPSGEPAMRYLIVVARNEPALYEHLRQRHTGDKSVRVVVDRRGARGDDVADVRPAVERRRRRSWLSTGASHELVDLARERTADTPKPQPIRHEEVPPQMNEIDTIEDTQRIARWLAESQEVLVRSIPALIEERDHLRQALEARDRECERLHGELGDLRHNFTALQNELERLRGERAAMADAFGGVVDLLGQLQRPLSEITRRLQGPQAVEVNSSAA